MLKINMQDEILAELGKMVIVFGLIESELSDMITALVTQGGNEAVGHIVAAELSFKQRVGIVDSILIFAKERAESPNVPDEHKQAMAELIACSDEFSAMRPRLFQAEELRNRLTHSTWGVPQGDPQSAIRFKTTAKAKRGLHHQSETFSLKELQDAIHSIGETWGELAQFHAKYLMQESEETEEEE
ncbi:MAG: hypothetical protein JST12_13140 [Armatimonadetes bacterium]|nr:hypothetical protein [Armatimonadota bacterium]